MSEESARTPGTWDDLDQAFTLPDWIALESPWRGLYNQMLDRTRRECSSLQLMTVHILIIERYLTGYICMRYREQHPFGDDMGFASATVAKDVNAWWLSLAREMNAMLAASRPPDRALLVRQTKEIIADAIQSLDQDDRKRVTQKVIAGFDRIGL